MYSKIGVIDFYKQKIRYENNKKIKSKIFGPLEIYIKLGKDTQWNQS